MSLAFEAAYEKIRDDVSKATSVAEDAPELDESADVAADALIKKTEILLRRQGLVALRSSTESVVTNWEPKLTVEQWLSLFQELIESR